MNPNRASRAFGFGVLAIVALLPLAATADDVRTERLMLYADIEHGTQHVEVDLKKPFDVYLVAERDTEDPQVSTVVFKLEVPEGLLVVGEELTVESLIALGTPKAGINLAFHCLDGAQVKIMHFRFVATSKLENAPIRLSLDPRTDFRGIVACKAEKYEKWDTEESVLTVSTR